MFALLRRHNSLIVLSLVMALWASFWPRPAAAIGQIQVSIENVQPADGFFFTPVWVSLHDGAFDVFTTGEPASNFPGLEEIAEGGDTSVMSADFNAVAGGHDQTIGSPGGFAGAPVFDPGETVNTAITVPNPTSNRYFSFASMVIPSNDAFFANGDPLAYEVFDSAGNFNGAFTITITGANVYDSGTEVNDMMGAAFSALGGTDSVQNGNVALHAGLDGFLGTGTAAGTTLGSSLNSDAVLARITVTPEPNSVSLLGIGSLLLCVYRRRAPSKFSR